MIHFKKQFFNKTRIIVGSTASAGARITTVVTMVLTTAIATRVMTKEEFGLWAVILSLMSLWVNFDFGFRYGMGNRLAAMVAQAGGATNSNQREFFLSILFFEIEIALAGIIIFLLLVMFLSVTSILKITQPDLITNINFLIFIILALLFLNNPTTLQGSGFFVYQEVNLACFLTAMQSIILMLVFWITTWFLSFKWILISYYFMFLLSGIICSILFFKKRGWAFGWIPIRIQVRHVRSLSQRSMEFFVHSIASTIIANVSTILAGSVAGLSLAGDFDLVKKIFSLLITLHLALLAPLAPAYTQSAQLAKWDWVNQKLSFCLKKVWPLIFLGVGGLIYFFHPLILKLWTGRDLSDYLLAGLLALVAVLSGWGNTYSVVLNSLGLVKWQAVASVVMAPLFIFLPLFMGKVWGLTGIASGTLICMIPGTFIWPAYARYALKAKLLRV